MIDFVLISLIVATISAFCLSLLFKLGAIEWLQLRGPKLIAEMANCNFCLSWWMCVIISVIAVNVTGDLTLLFVPITATKLTQILL